AGALRTEDRGAAGRDAAAARRAQTQAALRLSRRSRDILSTRTIMAVGSAGSRRGSGMAATWDAPTRKKFREYIQLLLALILGAIVLLPTLVGLTKPPFALAWAVPVMLSLASLSVACLGVAMLYVVLGAQAPPFRLIGTGTWAGLAALFLMLVYVVTNVLVDMRS